MLCVQDFDLCIVRVFKFHIEHQKQNSNIALKLINFLFCLSIGNSTWNEKDSAPLNFSFDSYEYRNEILCLENILSRVVPM